MQCFVLCRCNIFYLLYLVFDRLFTLGDANCELQDSSDGKTARDVQSVREALSSKKQELQKESGAGFSNAFREIADDEEDDDDDASFDARMRRQILQKRKELGDLPPKPKLPGTEIISGSAVSFIKLLLHRHEDFCLFFLLLLWTSTKENIVTQRDCFFYVYGIRL